MIPYYFWILWGADAVTMWKIFPIFPRFSYNISRFYVNLDNSKLSHGLYPLAPWNSQTQISLFFLFTATFLMEPIVGWKHVFYEVLNGFSSWTPWVFIRATIMYLKNIDIFQNRFIICNLNLSVEDAFWPPKRKVSNISIWSEKAGCLLKLTKLPIYIHNLRSS